MQSVDRTTIVSLVAAASVKRALVARTEWTGTDGVERRWCALEEYLVENASTKRAFREDRTLQARIRQICPDASNTRRYDPARIQNEHYYTRMGCAMKTLRCGS